MKTYTNYNEAVEAALATGLPLWDTHTTPDRYVVGHLSAEVEAAAENAEWTEVQLTLERISDVQSALARIPGYANHEKEQATAVLGTGHALAALGKLTDAEAEAFVTVGAALNQAVRNVGVKK